MDAVFSMEGTVADLATIAELADRHAAGLCGRSPAKLGVLGPDGRGASAALGVLARMDVVMGTFSRRASVGGFIARSARRGLHPARGSGHVFPPAAASRRSCHRAALRVGQREPDRRAQVLAAAGSTWPPAWHGRAIQASITGTAIVPVILGNPTVAHTGYLRLMRSRVYGEPGGPQPCRRSVRFRQLPSRPHRQSDLDRALRVCRPCRPDRKEPRYERPSTPSSSSLANRPLASPQTGVLVDDLGFDSLKLFS